MRPNPLPNTPTFPKNILNPPLRNKILDTPLIVIEQRFNFIIYRKLVPQLTAEKQRLKRKSKSVFHDDQAPVSTLN